MPPSPIVLVTGASRGIGAELCRQLLERGCTVIGAARRPESVPFGEPLALDVDHASSVRIAAETVRQRWERVDVLVNNAAILLDQGDRLLDLEPGVLRTTLDTNLLGPLRMAQAFWDLLPRGGRIVNVSSQSGQLAGMDGWAPAYSISKAALNALTVQLAQAGRNRGIEVLSACPGWVRTDMGGPEAPGTVEEGAARVLWAALDAPQGASGGFWQGPRRLEW